MCVCACVCALCLLLILLISLDCALHLDLFSLSSLINIIDLSQVILAPLYGANLNISSYVFGRELLDYFDVSGEWEVAEIAVNKRKTSIGGDRQYIFVAFSLTLKRRYYFYLLTVLFPMVILSVTGACGFLLPLQCGEKVSFQVRKIREKCLHAEFRPLFPVPSSTCRFRLFSSLQVFSFPPALNA